jgi:hypothetical protein
LINVKIDPSVHDALDKVDALLAQVRQQIAGGLRRYGVTYAKRDGKSVLEITLDAAEEQPAPQAVSEVVPATARAGKKVAVLE